MFGIRRLALLGMIVVHGVGLVAMDKEPKSPRKNLITSLKRSVELCKEEKGKIDFTGFCMGCGTRDIADRQLAQRLIDKNDYRVHLLPI